MNFFVDTAAIVTFRVRCSILAISKTQLLVTIVNRFYLCCKRKSYVLGVAWILDPLPSFLRFVMVKYFLLQSRKMLLAC